MRLEAAELARWIRFAAKGGIGKCTAITDCVAEREEDLMFLKDDEITVLLQIADKDGLYLGYCEGVVGRFSGADVQFHSRLKKAVMTKRSSVTASTSSTKSPTPYQTVSSPSPGPPSRPGSSTLRIQAQIPARGEPNADNQPTGQRHPPSLSLSAASATTDSALSTPAAAQFSPSISSDPAEPHSQTRYIPSPLRIASEPTSPLRISKKTSSITTSPPPSAPPDTSYSTFEDHAKRLSIGNDTEIGIGLSLLQDLANDDDYSDEEDEEWTRGSQTARIPVVNRYSAADSQEGTVEGLDYAKSEDHDHLSPLASPASFSFPPPPHQSHHTSSSASASTSASSPPINHPTERERRPSLAPSATSITTTSSWEGASDIYDNYRYSRYSMKQSSGSERTRTDSLASASVRARTDSNRSRTDSSSNLGRPRGFTDHSDHPPSPSPSVPNSTSAKRTTLRDRTTSIDSDASVYTRDSRLSSLSKDARQLFSESQAQDSPQSLRPAPLPLDAGSSHPEPLLHTDWGSPTSPTGFPDSKSVGVIKTSVGGDIGGVGLSPPSSIAPSRSIDSLPQLASANVGQGLASAVRQRVENVRHSDDTIHRERQKDRDRDSGLGSRIVVEDDEDLPSRVGLSDSPELDLDASNSTVLGELALGSVQGAHAGLDDQDDDDMIDLSMGRLGKLTITNRTPSPLIRENGSDATCGSSNASTNTTTTPIPPTITTTTAPSPPSSPSTSPATRLAPPQRENTSRLSLADLREPTGPLIPGSSDKRQSLFLPHPNAPKPPPVEMASRGPMYVQVQGGQGPPPQDHQQRQQQDPKVNAALDTRLGGFPLPPTSLPLGIVAMQQPNGASPPQQQIRSNVIGVMRMALGRVPHPGPGHLNPHPPNQKGPTIYGRTECDLTSANGPVPIMWSVDPLGSAGATGPPASLPGPHQGQGVPSPQVPSIIAAQARPSGLPSQQHPHTIQQQPLGQPAGMGPGPGLGLSNRATMPARSSATRSASVSVGPGEAVKLSGTDGGTKEEAKEGATYSRDPASAAAAPIPRANFFPKTPGARPRSRSFSSFNSSNSREPEVPFASDPIKRSFSPTSKQPQLAKSSPLRPSPLSLPQNVAGPSLPVPNGRRPSTSPSSPSSATFGSSKPPSSPLAQAVTVPSPTTNSPLPSPSFVPNLAGRTLRNSSSRATLNDGSFVGGISRPSGMARSTLPPGTLDPSSSSNPTPSSSSASLTTTRLVSNPVPRSSSPTPIPLSSQPETTRVPSVRTKLSLPNLRRNQSKLDENDHLSPSSPIQEAPSSPAVSTMTTGPMAVAELLQVQDMEFELVRPTALWNQAARTSEDSNVLGRGDSIDAQNPTGISNPAIVGLGSTPIPTSPTSISGPIGGFLRPDSPAVSVSSGGHGSIAPSVGSSFATGSAGGLPGSKNGTDTDISTSNAPSMEAHRAREQKWLTLISSSPASSARKNKKVKKLVMDGVPGSVRYPVWSYLTDGKAKCVPGVYEQLCKRGKVPCSDEIERDVERCFMDQTHLHGTKGGVVTLLQAYLSMVPDVRYSMGLTLIVGQLVLLSPEEEAFWIFVSVMDTHIRPWFSKTSTLQMEVDAALFAKALEMNDGQVAKKVLMELSVEPVIICERWFTTLFVGVLPQEYVYRVWDHFLYEGVPFLIRVGLATMTCIRQRILVSMSEESLLAVLRQPPPSLLPSSPDAFISLAYTLKVKDDDVRKQRIKMEAQLKRQTQQVQQVPRTGSSGLGISLPR